MKSEKLKSHLKEIFAKVIEADNFDPQAINEYFHPNYVQRVNGETLNFAQFVQHIKKLKETLGAIKIHFDHLIAEGNSVSSVHYAEGYKKDGTKVKAKLVAFFKFEDDKVILCEEVTYLLEGNQQDQSIGSTL